MNLRNVTIGFFVLIMVMFICSPLALYLNARPEVAQRLEHGFLGGAAITAIVLASIVVLAAAFLAAFYVWKRSSLRRNRAMYRRSRRLPLGYVIASPESRGRRTGLGRTVRPEKTTWLE